jgi:hypothetical protein
LGNGVAAVAGDRRAARIGLAFRIQAAELVLSLESAVSAG